MGSTNINIMLRRPNANLVLQESIFIYQKVNVFKTFVLVPMALQQRAQHVPPMVLIFVCLVPVNITKSTTHALNAPVVYRANTNQEHRAVAVVVPIHKVVLLVQTVVRRISVERAYPKQDQIAVAMETVIPKHVLKTFVLAPVALKQRAKHVPPMVLIFVRLVPVNITKPATPALVVLRLVAPGQQKRLLAFRHRIVFVLKTFVLVPTALQQWAQIVLPMMLIFVRLVPVDITKLATMLVLHVPVDNIKLSVDNPRVKPVPLDNTKNKVGNPLAKHVPVVLTVM